MTVNDVLNKMFEKAEENFMFYVNNESVDIIEWQYVNGFIMSTDEKGFHWHCEHSYDKDDEVIIIEEKGDK